jgi:hypothetical protein
MTREKDGEDLMLRASAFQMTRSIAHYRYKIKTVDTCGATESLVPNPKPSSDAAHMSVQIVFVRYRN